MAPEDVKTDHVEIEDASDSDDDHHEEIPELTEEQRKLAEAAGITEKVAKQSRSEKKVGPFPFEF